MKMMNERMANICRGAISSIAGVDNEIMAAVVAMRMRSFGASAETGAEMVGAMLQERTKASEDYAY